MCVRALVYYKMCALANSNLADLADGPLHIRHVASVAQWTLLLRFAPKKPR